jgi:hypothetical protein
VTGFAFPELEITGNTITPRKATAIVCLVQAAFALSIIGWRTLEAGLKIGIRLVTGLLALGLTPIVVSGNRLQGLASKTGSPSRRSLSLQNSSTMS